VGFDSISSSNHRERQTPALKAPTYEIVVVVVKQKQPLSPTRPTLRHTTMFRATLPLRGPFTSKPFRSSTPTTLAQKYRALLQKHPFLLFGLPFLTTIVAGSFALTPATALRYERYDRKNQQVSREEAMGLGKERRKVDMREEYYVSLPAPFCVGWMKMGMGREKWG
jgi:cytochrome c oxidase assembly protein subunit 16